MQAKISKSTPKQKPKANRPDWQPRKMTVASRFGGAAITLSAISIQLAPSLEDLPKVAQR